LTETAPSMRSAFGPELWELQPFGGIVCSDGRVEPSVSFPKPALAGG
jgi:hypothetical protein